MTSTWPAESAEPQRQARGFCVLGALHGAGHRLWRQGCDAHPTSQECGSTSQRRLRSRRLKGQMAWGVPLRRAAATAGDFEAVQLTARKRR